MTLLLKSPMIIPIDYIGIQKSSGRGLWILTEDWTYGGFTVKKGFVTDGGSIPRPLWFFLNPTGQGMAAYVIHDWLYTTHELSRLESDKVLSDLLIKLDIGWFPSLSAFWAVRAFGGGKRSWDAPGPTENDAI